MPQRPGRVITQGGAREADHTREGLQESLNKLIRFMVCRASQERRHDPSQLFFYVSLTYGPARCEFLDFTSVSSTSFTVVLDLSRWCYGS